MPIVGESMVPWLAGAFVLAAGDLALGLSGVEVLDTSRSLLLLGLCAALATAGLVAARAARAAEATLREERARPALDELGSPATERSGPYLQGMHGWMGAVLELLDHAVAASDPASPQHAELAAAAAEARDLQELFVADGSALTINDQARLHALGSLWEASQARVEQVAAAVDPHWHRRWRARHVDARLLRHGQDLPRPVALPYR
jgi:hypothetical protein